MQFLNGYYVALQSKLPFHVALLQVLQTGKQSAMLLIILCYIYYVHLHTIYSVNDYKSLDFLSKLLLLSYLTQWCFLWMKILFCLSRHRSLMCYVLYKCTVRIGCTRSSSLFKEVKQHWARFFNMHLSLQAVNGVDKFYKETRSQKVNDQFQQISVPNTRVVQILRRFIE